MFKVHIELQRVQTWLFAMPQLRAMIGANVLLGETLRLELRELLVNSKGAWKPHPVKGFPQRASDDQLNEAKLKSGGSLPDDVFDDPKKDAEFGILARDGGHFVAVFVDKDSAEAFAKQAAARLREKVPGLRFSCKAEEVVEGKEHRKREPRPAQPFLSIELPVFARCDWAGRGLASKQVEPGGDPLDRADVSLDAAARAAAGDHADNGHAKDLVTLMNRIALSKASANAQERRLADTFEELADGKYLAVIHADGNGVGKEAKKLSEDPQQSTGPKQHKQPDKLTSWLEAEAKRAHFFHKNRVLLRKALVSAIKETAKFPPCKNRRKTEKDRDKQVSPFLPLMLGGDDLLVACRADLAMPFVQALCEALEEEQKDKKDKQDFRLTLGIGVAIASYSMPFHQLHAVAEACASSAKRKTRDASAIDWAVFTASWAEKDLADVRRRDWVRDHGKRILSQRPMCVLDTDDKQPSLAGLLSDAALLTKAPRAQLHYLKEQLSAGEHLAELAFAELSAEAKKAFDQAGISKVWEAEGANPKTTPILDLIELSELRHLGKKPATNHVSTNTEQP